MASWNGEPEKKLFPAPPLHERRSREAGEGGRGGEVGGPAGFTLAFMGGWAVKAHSKLRRPQGAHGKGPDVRCERRVLHSRMQYDTSDELDAERFG